jgi:hypothetical protein
MQREVPPSWRKRARERIVVLKREPLDAKRSSPVRDEESKGKDSCPEKRASRCKEKSPSQGGRDVLKREPLDAERSQQVREEESKGMASCPEKDPKVTSLCVATDGSWRMKVCRDGCSPL